MGIHPDRRPGALWTGATTNALALGLVHALVDASCGFLVFRDLGSGRLDRATVVGLVVLYNGLAFAGQGPIGYVADRFRAYRALAVAGVALAAIALWVAPVAAAWAVVIIGVGNAAFHVGAGAHVLRESADRSTESGVFVGPGALGLAAGIWIGGHGYPLRTAITVLLVLAVPVLIRAGRETSRASFRLASTKSAGLALVVVCAVCFAGSVTVRSAVGGTVAGMWRAVSVPVMWGLAMAACFGKMLGGFLADRLGWLTTTVLALAASALLITYLGLHPVAAVVGMLLFQTTMPVTLKAMHHLMPSRPGLAFGLPCMALFLGALPGLLAYRLLSSWPLALGSVFVSILLVVLGLRSLRVVGGSVGPGSELLFGRGASRPGLTKTEAPQQ